MVEEVPFLELVLPWEEEEEGGVGFKSRVIPTSFPNLDLLDRVVLQVSLVVMEVELGEWVVLVVVVEEERYRLVDPHHLLVLLNSNHHQDVPLNNHVLLSRDHHRRLLLLRVRHLIS